MLNWQRIFIGLLCVLSLVPTALSEEMPPDSHIITVPTQINLVELNNNVKSLSTAVQNLTEIVEKLSENMVDLNKNIGVLNTKVAALDERTKGVNESVGALNEKVAALDERTERMAKWQYGILAGIGTIFISIVIFLLKQVYSSWKKGSSENKAAPANTTQVSRREEISPEIPNVMDYLNRKAAQSTPKFTRK